MALLGLAVGLSVAAAIAVIAILTHSLDALAARLIGTSLGVSVFSALGASGEAARRQPRTAALGVFTAAVAGLAFVLLEVAIWDSPTVWTWRVFGVVAVVTLAASHASLVMGARRIGDSRAIISLTLISLLTAVLDTILAAIAIAGLVHHISSEEIRLSAILVIVMLLSTALPPVLRRANQPPRSLDPDLARSEPAFARDSGELRQIAHRLEELVPVAGDLADKIHREAARLRELANRPPPP